MQIGVPKEIKNNESRVGLTPLSVSNLVGAGHSVLIEKNAGVNASYFDEEYEAAGATLTTDVEKIWKSEMVIKVKEPLKEEYKYLREDLILFTYLHLAPNKELTDALLESKTTGIAYETIQLPDNSLPLLVPMSQIAGRLSIQIGAQYLESIHGGKGVLLSGATATPKGNVVIIGGGHSGYHAAEIAVGMGANVTILDVNATRLAELEQIFNGRVQTLISTPATIEKAIKTADLVIGAVLIPGAKAPTLVTKEMVAQMEPNSVIIDIAIDQGGIFETIDRITTHDEPVYNVSGVQHYAVANMPGAVPKTATQALTNVTIPYILQIANKGLAEALNSNDVLKKGLNTYKGTITNEAVASALDLPFNDSPELV